MKPYKFKIPVLDCDVMVCFNKTHQDASKHLSKFLKIEFDSSGAIGFVMSNAQRIGVWVPLNLKWDTLSHENHHIVRDAYEFAGCKMGADEEMDANFIGYVGGKMLTEWEARKKASSCVPASVDSPLGS